MMTTMPIAQPLLKTVG